MPESNVQFHIRRGDSLRSDRGVFNNHCEEVAQLVMPSHRNTFTGNGWTQPDAKKTDKQFDSTASIAVHRFASVFESLLTPQSSLWHRLVPAEPELKRSRPIRLYLDSVNDLLYRYRQRPIANYVSQSQMTYLSLGLYGNGSIFIDGAPNGKGMRYKNMHIGETYFAENHQGIVDTFYRFFKLTALQAVEWFGDMVPDSIKSAAENATQGQKQFDFIHCVYPRKDYDSRRVDSQGLPFASLYISREGEIPVRESGYSSFPAPVSRYVQAPGETYGRGPAMMVLPGIKVLNEEKKAVIKQGHLALDPALIMFDDGMMSTVNRRAGATNSGGVSAEGRPLIQALPIGSLAVGEEMMKIEREAINDAFLITLFQILTENPQMTATEVLERTREKGMLIAPTAGRQQSELLGPQLERELDILASQGVLPPMPPLLAEAGGGYHVEYDSPMARMQRMENATGFMRSLDTASNYAKMTGDMTPLDWFDMDVAMPALLDINGAPVAWTATEEAVAAKRQQRAQAEQQRMAIENAGGLSGAAKVASDMQQQQGQQGQ